MAVVSLIVAIICSAIIQSIPLLFGSTGEIITEKFADVIASGNKGMIMKAVMGELKGKADGKLINKVVADLTK